MWEWLTSGLCGKHDKTHVWNIEQQRHFTTPGLPQKVQKEPVQEVDRGGRRRMDSYYVVEGTTQTVIRQEVYQTICLQKKSPFFTQDLFSVSMRNVNERIINERKIIIPLVADKDGLSSMDGEGHQDRVVQAQVENIQDTYEEDSWKDLKEKDVNRLEAPSSMCTVEDEEEELAEDHSMRRPKSLSTVNSWKYLREEEMKTLEAPSSESVFEAEQEELAEDRSVGRQPSCSTVNTDSCERLIEDMDTVVTDVDEDDSIENLVSVGVVSNGHEEEQAVLPPTETQDRRYGRVNVVRWMKDMPALERTCNGALALHYAAARGCLDCVRLLVDASSDLG